jgi:tight adherence protein C
MFAIQLQYDLSAITWFALTLGSLAVVARIAVKSRPPVDKRLEALAEADESNADAAARLNPAITPPAGRRGRKPDARGGVRARMLQAGLYSPGTLAMFNILRTAGFFAPIVAGFWLGHVGLLTPRSGLLFGLTLGLAGALVPGLWLDHLKFVRQTKIRRSLPDALDVMSVCLQGGLSLNVALAHVARELNLAHPALASELNIMERQIQMGRSTGDAIREMANRFDLDELRSMSSVISQAERIGASVATALELFADTMRVKRHQRAEELAHKASVKLMIPTLLCVFPAIFIVILGPAVVRFVTEVLPGFSH